MQQLFPISPQKYGERTTTTTTTTTNATPPTSYYYYIIIIIILNTKHSEHKILNLYAHAMPLQL